LSWFVSPAAAEQEYPSPAGDLRARQSVYSTPVSIALPTGVICLTSPLTVPDAADLTPNNHTPTPTLSLVAAISIADIYSQLLVQTFPEI
jgi:hypothetical protein